MCVCVCVCIHDETISSEDNLDLTRIGSVDCLQRDFFLFRNRNRDIVWWCKHEEKENYRSSIDSMNMTCSIFNRNQVRRARRRIQLNDSISISNENRRRMIPLSIGFFPSRSLDSLRFVRRCTDETRREQSFGWPRGSLQTDSITVAMLEWSTGPRSETSPWLSLSSLSISPSDSHHTNTRSTDSSRWPLVFVLHTDFEHSVDVTFNNIFSDGTLPNLSTHADSPRQCSTELFQWWNCSTS